MNIATLASAIFALAAAGFWLASARVRVGRFLDMPMDGPGSPSDIMQRQSKWSAFAAVCAAVSAIAGVVSAFIR
jgi:hypothetical protein